MKNGAIMPNVINVGREFGLANIGDHPVNTIGPLLQPLRGWSEFLF
jgi:hypothetical protein